MEHNEALRTHTESDEVADMISRFAALLGQPCWKVEYVLRSGGLL